MAPISGPITFSSTGSTTVPLPFTPSALSFYTGSKFGVNETTNARSGAGFATADYQWATAQLTNASGKFTRNYLNDACFAILDGVSGNPIVKGSLVSINTNSVTFNIANASSLFQVFMTVWP